MVALATVLCVHPTACDGVECRHHARTHVAARPHAVRVELRSSPIDVRARSDGWESSDAAWGRQAAFTRTREVQSTERPPNKNPPKRYHPHTSRPVAHGGPTRNTSNPRTPMTPYDRTDGYSSQALAASKIGFTSLRSAQRPEGTCEAGAEGARATHLSGATRMKRCKGNPATFRSCSHVVSRVQVLVVNCKP